MLALIGRSFGKLATFGGRDGRTEFWTYAAAVLGLAFIGAFIGIGPIIGGTFARMEAFAREHPDQATITSTPGSYSISIQGDHPELAPDVGAFMTVMAVVVIAIVLLLAAAVVRRLRDAGRPGWLGLLPLPFLGIGLGLFPRLFGNFDAEPDVGLVMGLFFNNLLYIAGLGILVFNLIKPTRAEG